MVRKFIESYGIAIVCLVAAIIYVSVAEAARPARDVSITEAKWESGDRRLVITGKTAGKNGTVEIFNANLGGLLEMVTANRRGRWTSETTPEIAPCRVRAESHGTTNEKDVLDAPADCDGGPGGGNQLPVANDDPATTNQDTAITINVVSNDNDPDGSIDETTVAIVSGVSNGSTTNNLNGTVSYTPNSGFAGTDSFIYTVMDDSGDTSNVATVTVTVNATGGGDSSTKSINSTSQNRLPAADVAEHPLTGNNNYRIFGTNDLGMHCGDFDTRISSILPPFNVLHAQVIQRGGKPNIMGPNDGVSVFYSAASNPDDPILTGINSAGSAILANGPNPDVTPITFPVLSSVAPNGTVYKTNFWDIVLQAYGPFYPPGILATFEPEPDQGLPMPNVEQLWLGNGTLTAEQQSMPGIVIPYTNNDPQAFELFTVDQPFFTTFPFGYVSHDVNWFEGAGVPITAFDDAGRENPWPLYRFQAHDGSGTVLASTDVVLPISGEANCGACHNDPLEDGGNGSATQALVDAEIDLATASDDIDMSVPLEVSKEWAADLNLIRLHDLKHSTNLEDNTPVVCQSCHYTPALDLAQVGPKGPGDADANGRQQTNVRSMSNVMHSHHGAINVEDNPDGTVSVVESGGRALFPAMPPAVNGNDFRDPLLAGEVLNETCYQCHPGRRTDCLRGAMATGGMLCQDCHGDMEQVGNDFSKDVTPGNPGDFHVEADFYTNPTTLRVPWANEPGCGSCHTGDVIDNMHADADTLGSPTDGIRLMQAFRIGDAKATPIVPTNKRFAENVVTADDLPGHPDAIGNPMLYRVSKGHEGVFCEACHGATHGIWPNGNPNANDNVAAMQLQGHTGTITECSTCHSSSFNIDDFKGEFDSNGWMKGPHGMHPVGSSMWNDKHKEVFEDGASPNGICESCHGSDGLGTALSQTATDRVFECKNEDGTLCGPDQDTIEILRGTPVGCVECHSNEIGRSGD